MGPQKTKDIQHRGHTLVGDNWAMKAKQKRILFGQLRITNSRTDAGTKLTTSRRPSNQVYTLADSQRCLGGCNLYMYINS